MAPLRLADRLASTLSYEVIRRFSGSTSQYLVATRVTFAVTNLLIASSNNRTRLKLSVPVIAAS